MTDRNNKVIPIVFTSICLILLILYNTVDSTFMMDNLLFIGIGAIIAGAVISSIINKIIDKRNKDLDL